MDNKTKDARRFVIVVTETGEMYTHDAGDSVLAAAQVLCGGGVTTVPCIDKRFVVLYGHEGTRNPDGSVLAQEYVTGAAVIACGPAARLRGFSKFGAKDTVKYLRGVVRRDYHV